MKKNIISALLIFYVGIYTSKAQWIQISPITNDYLQSTFFVDSLNFYVWGSKTLLHTTDGGSNWEILDTNFSYYTTIWFDKEGNGYRGFGELTSNQVGKTKDNGKTWTDGGTPGSSGSSSLYFFNKDTGISTGYWGEVYKTYDGGISWKLIMGNNDVTSDPRFKFINDSVGYFYAPGYQYGSHAIYKTTDQGETWLINSYIPVTNSYDGIFELSVVNENTMYAIRWSATKGENDDVILKTIDGGQNWQEISMGASVAHINFITADNGFISLANDTLPLETNDGLNTWSHSANSSIKLSPFIFGYNIESYKTHNGFISFMVGLNGEIYKRFDTLSSSGTSSMNDILIGNPQLNIYPNPAQTSININYSGKEPLQSLKIFNLMGKMVYENNKISSNTNRISVDFFNEGIYMLEATTAKKKYVQKIDLIK